MVTTSPPPRVFDLVDTGDGVSWVPYDDLASDTPEPAPAIRRAGKPAATGGTTAGVTSYRATAERRIERRKRPRPRPLDVSV